ncbi:MAG: prolyl oligopeptidase family serine peptidase [Opitutaceae bacterium]|nr:prolyl oligopeptidase family serine peptidase [Opitutaceae bacterium]
MHANPIRPGLRFLVPLCCLLAVVLSGATPLPVARLFDLPAVSPPKVSPNGQLVAFGGNFKGVHHLVLIDTGTLKDVGSVPLKDFSILDVWWKADDSVLVLLERELGGQELRNYHPQTRKFVRLTAENSRFGNLYSLTTPGIDGRTTSWRMIDIVSLLPQDPEHVLVRTGVSSNSCAARRINIRTGSSDLVEPKQSYVRQWIADRDGRVVAAKGLDYTHKVHFMLWRAAPGSPWQRLELGTGDFGSFLPLAAHPEPGRILGLDQALPGPNALIALNPATGEKEVLFQHPELDLDGIVFWDQQDPQPVAVAYEAEQPSLHFLDETAARIQAGLDESLPDRRNQVYSRSLDLGMLAVYSVSSTSPGKYLLFDRRNRRISLLGEPYPGLKGSEFSPSAPFAFKSHDGLVVRGRFWTPPGNPPKPALVVIADERQRARADFNPEVQFYTTRGYAVAQIDYRGTYGYGRAFREAGDTGLAATSADDLIKGVELLVNRGLVDGNRVALHGRDWGGLVAIYALAKSDRFALWLNYSTKTTWNSADTSYTSEWSVDRRAVEALDLKTLLPRIKTPSIHLYAKSGISVLLHQHIRGQGAKADLVTFEANWAADSEVVGRRELEARTKMAELLLQRMPARID